MREAGENMKIDAREKSTGEINTIMQNSATARICLHHVLGQRYIANGSSGKQLQIHGTLGNNLGSFLNGTEINVFGNVQEACGDTMNDGKILIHGRCGDALGYGMRGGKIFVRGDGGSRCGIHMKAYKDKIPLIVIGGNVKDFLGEYLSGGIIIVLNLRHAKQCVGKYCGSGAHGGKIYLRIDDSEEIGYTKRHIRKVTPVEQSQIDEILQEYARDMQMELPKEMAFYSVEMDTGNPYEGLYTDND